MQGAGKAKAVIQCPQCLPMLWWQLPCITIGKGAENRTHDDIDGYLSLYSTKLFDQNLACFLKSPEP